MSERTMDTNGRGGSRRFEPAAFFETAAKGRSKHRKGEIVFSQGATTVATARAFVEQFGGAFCKTTNT
jgi:hypothetical protein